MLTKLQNLKPGQSFRVMFHGRELLRGKLLSKNPCGARVEFEHTVRAAGERLDPYTTTRRQDWSLTTEVEA